MNVGEISATDGFIESPSSIRAVGSCSLTSVVARFEVLPLGPTKNADSSFLVVSTECCARTI